MAKRPAACLLLLYWITIIAGADKTVTEIIPKIEASPSLKQNSSDLSLKLSKKLSEDGTMEPAQRQLSMVSMTLKPGDTIRTQLVDNVNLEAKSPNSSDIDAKLPLDHSTTMGRRMSIVPDAQAPKPTINQVQENGEKNTTETEELPPAPETTSSEKPAVTPTTASFLGNNSTSAATSESQEYLSLNPELRQKILDGLDKLIGDFEDLHGTFKDSRPEYRSVNTSIVKRMVRSPLPPVKPRKKCEVTHDQLKELDLDIRRTLANISSLPSKGAQCTLNQDNPNNCDEWITNIQCGMLHLKRGFQQTITISGKVPVAEVTLWKNAYESLKAKFDSVSDKIRASVSQEFQFKVDKLEKDLQDLQQSVDLLEGEMKDQRLQLQKAKTELCARAIQQGQYEAAMDKFKELGDDTLLKEVVMQAYAGSITNLPKVIGFVKKLPNCRQFEIASPVVFDQMEAHGHLNSPQVLSLSLAGHICSVLDFNNSYPALRSLWSKLENLRNTVIEEWGAKIRAKNYDEIVDFGKEYESEFMAYLEQIVKSAYSNDIRNAENVIKFIDNLTKYRYDVIGYSSLFDEMVSSNGLNGHELFMLAFRCKERMEGEMGGATESEKQRLEDIKGRLPNGVRALLWDSHVYIKSKKHSGYYLCLREVPQGAYLSAHGFGSTNKFDPYACESSETKTLHQWNVTPLEKGRYFRFVNKNKQCGYFGANRCTPDDYKSDFQWEVIPIQNGEFFYLKRKDDQKILSVKDQSGWSKFWAQLPSNCDGVERKDSLDYDLSLWSIS